MCKVGTIDYSVWVMCLQEFEAVEGGEEEKEEEWKGEKMERDEKEKLRYRKESGAIEG
jgi:hypothetical protein